MSNGDVICVKSKEGKEFHWKLEYVKKVKLLLQMIEDVSYNGEEAIPLFQISTAELELVTKWLALHEEEEPKTEEGRQLLKFDLRLSEEDTALFEELVPRSRLCDLINAADYLEIPDLTDSLIKFVSVNVDGRDSTHLSQWLEVPLAEVAAPQQK
uniref:Skp1_POZ domain-containing protein n=1 Tax=Steinernema glaseri TaxID=37863 RepID=A0A1I7YLF2_9BILA